VDDFMVFASVPTSSTATTPATATSSSGVVLLPSDMDLTLEASIKQIIYGETKLENFSGELALQKGKLLLKKTKVGIAGATISMEGEYAPVNKRKATFGMSFKADSFDVKRAYNEVPLFREMATSAENAEGLVSVDYQLQGRLNDKMEPVYPSIKGMGWVKLEQVKVDGLKLFGAVAKATEKDSIGNPDMKAVVIKSSIANNIITLERTKIKTMGFRLRMEGQTSLDGRLNLRLRLGLPPFGVIGIPMTITGTSDEPIVTVRKGKEADELEETDDDDDEGN
jgi:AsmA protein